jgi:hypothetical protein
MEFYLAMKNNEILSFASKWIGLENNILSEVSQAQKPKIVCSPSSTDFRPKTNANVVFSSTELEKRAEQVLPGRKGLGKRGKGWGLRGERWPKQCMHI